MLATTFWALFSINARLFTTFSSLFKRIDWIITLNLNISMNSHNLYAWSGNFEAWIAGSDLWTVPSHIWFTSTREQTEIFWFFRLSKVKTSVTLCNRQPWCMCGIWQRSKVAHTRSDWMGVRKVHPSLLMGAGFFFETLILMSSSTTDKLALNMSYRLSLAHPYNVIFDHPCYG